MTPRAREGRKPDKRHDGAFEVEARQGPGGGAHEAARPAPAQVSNRAREAQAARERAEGEPAAFDDFMRRFTGGGFPPLPPPPGLGGDPDDAPYAAGATDPCGDDGDPLPALAAIRPGATTRRPPALPAPPQPVVPPRSAT